MNYTEKVYLMKCLPGWREHYDSGLDQLTEITPKSVIQAIHGAFQRYTFDTDAITKWVQEVKTFQGREKELPTLIILEEPECHTCGHDPEISYELNYQRSPNGKMSPE